MLNLYIERLSFVFNYFTLDISDEDIKKNPIAIITDTQLLLMQWDKDIRSSISRIEKEAKHGGDDMFAMNSELQLKLVTDKLATFTRKLLTLQHSKYGRKGMSRELQQTLRLVTSKLITIGDQLVDCCNLIIERIKQQSHELRKVDLMRLLVEQCDSEQPVDKALVLEAVDLLKDKKFIQATTMEK